MDHISSYIPPNCALRASLPGALSLVLPSHAFNPSGLSACQAHRGHGRSTPWDPDGPGARSLGAWRLDDDIPQSAMALLLVGGFSQPL